MFAIYIFCAEAGRPHGPPTTELIWSAARPYDQPMCTDVHKPKQASLDRQTGSLKKRSTDQTVVRLMNDAI